MVQYEGSHTYLPVWSSECKGKISIFTPRRSEISGTRVFFLPWIRINTWTTEKGSVLTSWPGLLLEEKNLLDLSLYLSPNLSFTLSWILLLQECLGWSWKKYLSQENSHSLFPTIYLSLFIPHSNYMWWSRKKTSLGIQTFQLGPSSTHSSHDQKLMLKRWAPHGTVVYVLPNFTQRSKHFQPCTDEGITKD